MLEERWDRVHTKTAVTAEALRAVRVVAERLIDSVGVREHGPLAPQADIDTRDRAFTYFTKTYAKVRRAIQFVRGEEGDGDKIAPSLWSKSAAPTRPAADPAIGHAAGGGGSGVGGADGSTEAPATPTKSLGTSVSTSPTMSAHGSG